MSIFVLKPACKDYLWGGNRLKSEYGISYDGDVLAEAWELSCHPDGPSTIAEGPLAGKTLQEYINLAGRQVLGTNCEEFDHFPLLIKLIDAKQNLSVQVHPDDAYALAHEGQYGKTEMWVVCDAEPGAQLYYGFEKEISREEFRKRIEDGTLTDVLHAVKVKKGDVLFIAPGTIHAIGAGILIAEIQQNSNVTYRVFDYNRVGKDGKKRELHIDKALDVTKTAPVKSSADSYPHLATCDYFTVDRLLLDGRYTSLAEGTIDESSFLSVLVLDGEGDMRCGTSRVHYRKGDSLFIPAGAGRYLIEGKLDALFTTAGRQQAAAENEIAG